MTDVELEKKAKLYADEHYNDTDEYGYWFSDIEMLRRAYFAGAKENGVIWDDLKKNPNDLPKNQNEVLCLLWEDSYYIGYYSTNCEMWCFSEFSLCKDENEGEVTAWCELPKFEMEK